MGWGGNKRRKAPTPSPSGWSSCPTCGNYYKTTLTLRRGGRAYLRGRRVHWPTGVGYHGQRQVHCPDPYHERQPYYPWPGRLEGTEQEHVASLPHVGPPPLSDEAKERAAKTRRRNRVRQGKSNR